MMQAPRVSKLPVILLVSVGDSYGGAETYYVKLAKILLSQNTVIAVVTNRHLQDEFRSLGIETLYAYDHSFSSNRYIATLSACWAFNRRYRPALAHLNGQPETYLAPFLRLLGLRLLTSRHTPFTDQFLEEGSRMPILIKRWMVLLSLRCANHTICVSRLLYIQLAAYLQANKLSYIPTWIEDIFLENYDKLLPKTILKVLFVGRVTTNKGIFDAIEAVRRCDNIHLTVVGDGDQMAEAQQLASGLPVTFAGFMSDCRPAYRESDLLLFPSREGFEGLPQVPLEAMAMGLPCLASDIASVLELAKNDPLEEAGMALAVYKQGNVEDLANQLNRLASDRAELQRLSKAGRAQVESHFTVSKVSEPYLRVFRDVFSA